VAIRLGLGTGSWLAPRFTLVMFGLDPRRNPEAVYATRLFGVRNATLGVGLLSSEGGDRRLWWRIGIVCDIADIAAALVCARRGRIPGDTRSVVILCGAGIAAVALGAAALAEDDV
jgi:hypothetical protein